MCDEQTEEKVKTVTGGSSGEPPCRFHTGKKVGSFENSNVNSMSPVRKRAWNQS